MRDLSFPEAKILVLEGLVLLGFAALTANLQVVGNGWFLRWLGLAWYWWCREWCTWRYKIGDEWQGGQRFL